MSDFFDNKENLEIEKESGEEESFLFSDPQKHDDKKIADPKKRRRNAVISAALALVLLATGTFAVIKLIPEKETDIDLGGETPSISVLDYETDELKAVSVTNKEGTFDFLSKEEKVIITENEEEKTETQIKWYLKGYTPEVCSTSKIEDVVSVVSNINALMTIDKKTPSDCGFDNPQITAKVTTDKDEEYSVFIGGESPDGSGTYLMTSKNDKIYLVESYTLDDLTFVLTDFANDSYIEAATFQTDISDYKDQSGNITTFDYVKISGKNYPVDLNIVPNTDSFAQYIYYKATSPMSRYADNVGDITTMFTQSTTVAGGYTFDVSSESLKKYGLDNPDIEVKMSIKGEEKFFKISEVDDTYCAVITGESKNIKKVAKAYLKVFDSKPTDFYYAPVAVYSVMDISKFSITNSGETYEFNLTPNDEEAENPYSVTLGEKAVKYDDFKNFYTVFVELMCTDFGTESLAAAPDTTVKITFQDGRAPAELEFTKYSATKYQYSINGVDMGRITSSAYNKLIKNLKNIVK
ncbi:MAG: DUF4340 domain-containing protein [Clostridia bacterium]|nr:DUF4340 domain-containing protein [Clostridia bacterium]